MGSVEAAGCAERRARLQRGGFAGTHGSQEPEGSPGSAPAIAAACLYSKSMWGLSPSFQHAGGSVRCLFITQPSPASGGFTGREERCFRTSLAWL